MIHELRRFPFRFTGPDLRPIRPLTGDRQKVEESNPRSTPTYFPAIDTKSENADTFIAATVPSVEPAPEPRGLPDRRDETALEFGDAPRSPAWNDLGADEPAGAPTSEFDSPSAHLDPVAELLRQRLGLPTGKSRTRRGRRLVRRATISWRASPRQPAEPAMGSDGRQRGRNLVAAEFGRWTNAKTCGNTQGPRLRLSWNSAVLDPTVALSHYIQTEIEGTAA